VSRRSADERGRTRRGGDEGRYVGKLNIREKSVHVKMDTYIREKAPERESDEEHSERGKHSDSFRAQG